MFSIADSAAVLFYPDKRSWLIQPANFNRGRDYRKIPRIKKGGAGTWPRRNHRARTGLRLSQVAPELAVATESSGPAGTRCVPI